MSLGGLGGGQRNGAMKAKKLIKAEETLLTYTFSIVIEFVFFVRNLNFEVKAIGHSYRFGKFCLSFFVHLVQGIGHKLFPVDSEWLLEC